MQADPLTLQFNGSILEQVVLAWLEHAVYGQIAAPFGYPTGCCASAYYGEEGIPAKWRVKLVLCETIEQLVGRLFSRSGVALLCGVARRFH